MQIDRPVRIGTAGWNIHRNSVARFDAEGSHLQRYSVALNGCEVNSSFYRPHQERTWERWGESVPSDFRFSVKAPKAITHEARLQCDGKVLLNFLKQIAHLRERLGPILFQLPPSFEFDDSIARKFLTQLRQNYGSSVVWEPRHESWFNPASDNLLKQFKIARVAADPACVPQAAEPGGYSELAYFRLHGSPRMYYSSYKKAFLSDLAKKIRDLRKTKEVWCVFDNTAAGFAIENALSLKKDIDEGK